MIDYKRYGIMQIWGAGRWSNAHRGYQEPGDGIYVFLNYEKVGFFKSNEEAQKLIDKLLDDAPVDLSEFAYYLKLK